jgi:hypothetical protein
VNLERTKTRPEDPSSERWLEYYREAKVRRRSRPPAMRTRTRLKRWRNRQRTLVAGGFLAVGVVVGLFYAFLVR